MKTIAETDAEARENRAALDGEVLYEVEKGIGSDLCAVWTAQGALTRFIKERAA